MAQQYGYGYGYQSYGYAQPAAVPQATPAYTGYSAPAPRATYPQNPAPAAAPQQPNVGYSPYQASQSSAASTSQAYVPPPPPQAGSNTGYRQNSQPAMPSQPPPALPPQPQQLVQHGGGGAGGGGSGSSYYNNSNAYKPLTSAYTPYHNQQSNQNTSSMPASAPQPKNTAVTTPKPSMAPPYTPHTSTPYTPRFSTTTTPTTSTVVGYPSQSYPQASSYASAANAYYKQVKENKGGVTAPMGPAMPYQQSYPSSTTASNASLTPVQQQVVQQYIHQKTSYTSGSQPSYMRKKMYTPPVNPQTYYCEVCKISAASALTYKTHLEGKSHKKKLAQQKITTNKVVTNSSFYCELCEVMCSNKDGLEAHVRGTRHTKVVNLYKRMGKPIPTLKIASSGGDKSSPVVVAAPKISFVGGKQLSSTGLTEYPDGKAKVYPPSAAAAAASTTFTTKPSTATPTTAAGATEVSTNNSTESTVATPQEEPEPEPIGEHLVVAVSGDPKFPHASHKCEMCDCYFNDEFARRAHVKGRRHRLNYKKMYDPKLYVEPTKAMKKELEKKKKQREMIGELRRTAAMVGGYGFGRGRGRGRGNRFFDNVGNYNTSDGGNFSASEDEGGDGWGLGMHPNEARRQDTLDRARMQQMRQRGMGDVYFPPHMLGQMPSQQARNPHDDRLVLNKHSSIYPAEEEMKAVNVVVADVEKALKVISDDLMKDKCQKDGTKSSDGEMENDEAKRDLKGVMRVGAFARGLLLKGECDVELVLMTNSKPDGSLFLLLSSYLPAKFEELHKSSGIQNIYNVSPQMANSAFVVITQVESYRIQVTITLTSPTMREEPTPEQAKADENEGVLDRQSCLAALAALRHTKWFQAMAHNLPSCVILMRVLKDICRRVPAWGVLDTWILQLLVQKCIVSANTDFTKPGDVFRRVMECVASGLFLPTGPGLSDPCEKGMIDASASLTAQERANITLSAQHALRLIAFGKLHLVLGVDPLDGGLGSGQEQGGEEEEKESGGATSAGTKREADGSAEGENEECKKRKIQA